MSNLELINSDGCGVCQWATLIHELPKLPFYKRWLQTLKDWFKRTQKDPTIIKKQVYFVHCNKLNKIKQTTEICMEYKGKPQLKLWGSKKDEEVPLDLRLTKDPRNIVWIK